MAEWQTYGETSFTDFGSVGETRPADGGMDDVGATRPDGFDNNSSAATIPDDPIWDRIDTKTKPIIDPPWPNPDDEKIRPTTGWLVCIEGVTKGKDYRLYDGYTYIGRGANNDISIPDDRISTEACARILYDSKSRAFFINEGNRPKNPMRVNDDLLFGAKELAPYDVITLGLTKLIFVPLCTEKFTWEE